MKNKLFKAACLVAVCVVTIVLFTGTAAPSATIDGLPSSIINNLGENPKTQHTFTWHTGVPVKTGFLEYCERSSFTSFNGSNIIRVTATGIESKNDEGRRYVHKVTLNDLKPGTEYVYRVGNASDGYSSQGFFKTAEESLSSFTFLNITDTQGGSVKDYQKWKNTLDIALQKFPEARFLVHTGDMEDNGQFIKQWDMFAGAVKSELMNIAIAPAVGNHDVRNTNKTNTNLKNFIERFNLPEDKNTGAVPGSVYSFDYGYAHIVVMNTECGSSNLKKQAEWLKADLAKTQQPWKIVALHRGPYGATYDTTDIRQAWGPVFDAYGVNLVLEGHDHNYMRSYPMKNKEKVSPGKGTVYIVGNTAGVKFYPEKKRSWEEVDIQPKMQMYIAVTVEKDKMVVNAYDVKNILRDTLTLKK